MAYWPWRTNCLRVKAQKKAADANKGGSQLQARAAGLQLICPSCRTQLANYKTLKQHMEAKHPGVPVPPEESFSK